MARFRQTNCDVPLYPGFLLLSLSAAIQRVLRGAILVLFGCTHQVLLDRSAHRFRYARSLLLPGGWVIAMRMSAYQALFSPRDSSTSRSRPPISIVDE